MEEVLDRSLERKTLDIPFKFLNFTPDGLEFGELDGKELRKKVIPVTGFIRIKWIAGDSVFVFKSYGGIEVVSTFTYQVRTLPVGRIIAFQTDFYPRDDPEYVLIFQGENSATVSLPISQVNAQVLAVVSHGGVIVVDVESGVAEMGLTGMGYKSAYFFGNGRLAIETEMGGVTVYEKQKGQVWKEVGTLKTQGSIHNLFPLPDGRLASAVEINSVFSFVAWDPVTLEGKKVFEYVPVEFDDQYIFFKDKRILRSYKEFDYSEPDPETQYLIGEVYTTDGEKHELPTSRDLEVSDFKYLSRDIVMTVDNVNRQDYMEESEFFSLESYKKQRKISRNSYNYQWGSFMLLNPEDGKSTSILDTSFVVEEKLVAKVPEKFTYLLPHSSGEKRLSFCLVSDFFEHDLETRMPIPKEVENIIIRFIVPKD